jgi:hypothetical protein
MDCVSCHTSTQREVDLSIPASIPGGPKRFISPAGITGYAKNPFVSSSGSLQNSNWNLRNFGYFFGQPTMSNRAVNETAAVADYVNRKILHARNPGLDCSDADQDGKVWECVRDAGTDCFAECKAAPGGNPPLDPDSPENLANLNKLPQCKARDAQKAGTFEELDDVTTITMNEADSRCLSRVLAGRITTGAFDLGCDTVEKCTLVVKNGLTSFAMNERESAKLAAMLKFATDQQGGKNFITTFATGVSEPQPQAAINCNTFNNKTTCNINAGTAAVDAFPGGNGGGILPPSPPPLPILEPFGLGGGPGPLPAP